MGLGTGATAAIVAGIGAGGALGGAALESNAAGKAAKTQAGAADTAAQLQAQEADKSLALQAGEYNNALGLSMPGVYAGDSALANLEYGLGINPQGSEFTPSALNPSGVNFPGVNGTTTATGLNGAPQVHQGPGSNISPVTGRTSGAVMGANQPGNPGMPLSSLVSSNTGLGSLDAPWNQTFTSPTMAQAEQDPGFQFQLAQGQKAIQNSAAARGGLLSDNTAEALDQFSQGLADTSYNDVYNRALNNYQTNYNTFQNNQANQRNSLLSLLGAGQTATNNLNSTGINAANTGTNTLLTAGNQIGQNINNAGAATASGYVGGANAYGGALGSLGSGLGGSLLLSSLLNGGGSAANGIGNIANPYSASNLAFG